MVAKAAHRRGARSAHGDARLARVAHARGRPARPLFWLGASRRRRRHVRGVRSRRGHGGDAARVRLLRSPRSARRSARLQRRVHVDAAGYVLHRVRLVRDCEALVARRDPAERRQRVQSRPVVARVSEHRAAERHGQLRAHLRLAADRGAHAA